MPWIRSGEQETLQWRLKRAVRRVDRRFCGDAPRRLALALSVSLVLTAFVLVLH